MKSQEYKDLPLYAINIHQKNVKTLRKNKNKNTNWEKSSNQKKENVIAWFLRVLLLDVVAEGKEPDPKVKLVASASDVLQPIER